MLSTLSCFFTFSSIFIRLTLLGKKLTVVISLIPWGLWSKVTWASLSWGGSSAGCQGVLGHLGQSRLMLTWSASGRLGCPLPLILWGSCLLAVRAQLGAFILLLRCTQFL